MKRFIYHLRFFFFLFDILMIPLTFLGGIWLWITRNISLLLGQKVLPFTFRLLKKIGVFPIVNHYYEPLFTTNRLTIRHIPRPLVGVDFNLEAQTSLLEKFHFQEELLQIPYKQIPDATDGDFFWDNGRFGVGDAEFFYSLIRSVQPKRIVEIGAGRSSLIAQKAIQQNAKEDANYQCKHMCIEPFEVKRLEKLGIEVLRKPIESVDLTIFSTLEAGDILFIDSSHIVRPQGDVLKEFLEILPKIASGVYIHFHDIYTPYDYPQAILQDKNLFWNEQYFLEAFLSFNDHFKVIGALQFLKHQHFELLSQVCPILKKYPTAEPGSFWIIKK